MCNVWLHFLTQSVVALLEKYLQFLLSFLPVEKKKKNTSNEENVDHATQNNIYRIYSNKRPYSNKRHQKILLLKIV